MHDSEAQNHLNAYIMVTTHLAYTFVPKDIIFTFTGRKLMRSSTNISLVTCMDTRSQTFLNFILLSQALKLNGQFGTNNWPLGLVSTGSRS